MPENIIKIKVIPNAKKPEVSEFGNGLKVKVNAPAEGNKANKAVIEILAAYFSVKPVQVKIIRGLHSQNKSICIE